MSSSRSENQESLKSPYIKNFSIVQKYNKIIHISKQHPIKLKLIVILILRKIANSIFLIISWNFVDRMIILKMKNRRFSKKDKWLNKKFEGTILNTNEI